MKPYLLLAGLFFSIAAAHTQQLVPFQDENGKYGLKVHKSDSVVIDAVYDKIYNKTIEQFSSSYYYFGIVKNGKIGLMNKQGKVLIEPVYDIINDKCDINEKLVWVRKGDFRTGKYGMINLEGDEVIEPKYDYYPSVFSEGLSSVKLNGKEGFIDKNGREVIPFIYEQATVFIDGLAAVKYKGKWGFIDRSGKMAIKNSYEEVKPFYMGLAAVRKKEKWGYIDKKGKTVVSFKYKTAGSFGPDSWLGAKAFVQPFKGQGFYMDKSGNRIN